MSFFNTHANEIRSHIEKALEYLQTNDMKNANDAIEKAYTMVTAHNTIIQQNKVDTLSKLLINSLLEKDKQKKIGILTEAITPTESNLYKKPKGGKRSKRTKRTKRSRRTRKN